MALDAYKTQFERDLHVAAHGSLSKVVGKILPINCLAVEVRTDGVTVNFHESADLDADAAAAAAQRSMSEINGSGNIQKTMRGAKAVLSGDPELILSVLGSAVYREALRREPPSKGHAQPTKVI
jgi:hypothetical protein